MLYVSRRIGPDKYGVVDSESGRETIYPWRKLSELCCSGGCTVEGVVIHRTSEHNGYVGNVIPYQPTDTLTKAQLKASMLLHVDVTVYNDAITRIAWDSDMIGHGVRVRLSDFGRKTASGIVGYKDRTTVNEVTFVLDDKIKIAKDAFATSMIAGFVSKASYAGVTLDVSEVTNRHQVWLAYKSFFMWETHFDSVAAGLVIDDDDRKRRMFAKLERRIRW